MYEHIQKISINNYIFYIHEDILKKTSAFKYISDTSISTISTLTTGSPPTESPPTESPPNLEIDDVTKFEIEYVFSLLYASQSPTVLLLEDEKEQPIAVISKILRTMMIIGIPTDIIYYYISETINCHKNFLLKLINEAKYEDYFLLVMKMYCINHDVPYIRLISSLWININFPKKNGISVVTKLICNMYVNSGVTSIRDFDYILGITHKYMNLDYNVRQILSSCEMSADNSFIKRIHDVYKDFFDTNIQITITNKDLKISELKINDEIIEFIHKKTYTEGTFGSNVLKTIATHIAQILLEVKKLPQTEILL